MSEYLKDLYHDFSVKETSIKTYIERIHSGEKTIEATTYQWLSLLKKKHQIIEEFRKTRQKTIPASQFSLEHVGDSNPQVSNENIKELDQKIQEVAQVLNHHFSRTEKDMTFLTQSFKDSMDLINQINDHFEGLFKGL